MKLSELPVSAAEATREYEAAIWSPQLVRVIVLDEAHIAPVIGEQDFARISDELQVWDAWPVQNVDGSPSELPGGSTLWMALAAPEAPDPDARHAVARIHLFQRDSGGWTPLGPVMPDGFSPGSREWSGSAVLADDRKTLTLYFTATGVRGESEPSFVQRLFVAHAQLAGSQGAWHFSGWNGLEEIVTRDPAFYMAGDAGGGVPGAIKAFRDPAYFRDPANGQQYLFFAGSQAGSDSAFNGVIGVARARKGGTEWLLMPPLISADTLNNELERPHAICHAGRYYLFWSTQSHVFNPEGPMGPTGLYGMVSDKLEGGWRPLNGSGLVFANPPVAPMQAYSWLVLPDLRVSSFVDNWGQG
ncbi:MAG: glycoside hydrolase family 68 protein, partial [Proteobacteria bacterium]